MAELTQQQPIVTFDSDGNMKVNSNDPKVVKFIHDMRDSEDGLELFCKFFLNEPGSVNANGGKPKKKRGSFTKPFTKFRKEFAQNISNTTIPWQWYMAHRSFGKTTLVWAELIRSILFRLTSFVVFCTSEGKLAERRTEALKMAIITNPRIVKYFGYMTPTYFDGVREAFGTKAWKLADPVTGKPFVIVVPKSNGAVINGLVEYVDGAQVRPDLIVTDDITDRMRVNDETYRSELLDWYYGTLLPCVENEDQPDPKMHRWTHIQRGERAPWRILLTDTFKHSAALIEVTAKDPDWTGNRYPMCEETEPGNGKIVSLVEFMTDEQAQAVYDRHHRVGKDERFFREFCCRGGQSKDNTFPREHQYYLEEEAKLNVNPLVTRILVMDPARSKNPKSCYTAILSVAIDCIHAKVWIRKVVREHYSHDEMKRALYDLAREMNADIVAVEDAGLNDHIQGPLERYFMTRGRNVEWVWLPTSRKNIDADGEYIDIKQLRGSAALWLYRPLEPTHPKGHVWHEECVRHSPLEEAQKSFPDCGEWDVMDTLGHVDYVMKKIGLFFCEQQPPAEKGRPRHNIDEWDDILDEEPLRLVI